MEDKWIKLEHHKLRNPCIRGITYYGPVKQYIFTTQKSNYKKICEKLNFLNKELDILYLSTYPSRNMNESNLTSFVAISHDKSVAWYKYEGNVHGGGQNYIFINDKKIKTTEFLQMSNDELFSL